MRGSMRTGETSGAYDEPVSTGFITPFDVCLAPRTKERPAVESTSSARIPGALWM